MNSLWTSDEAVSATLGRATEDFEVSGLSIDTRTLRNGDLFVALKGEARDGHEFVRAAFDAGAAAALVSGAPDGMPAHAPLLLVANTLRGLEDLGRASRTRSHARIVAVTGSVGKTTTKEMLRLALSALGETSSSAASYNNHWGVPLSLAAMARAARFAVFEVGMNRFGEVRTLTGFVRPHVALITSIAPAHLEFFGSCEAIADAKSEIFEGLLPGGAALVPSDIPYTDRLIARAKQAGVSRVMTFGETAGSDARLCSIVESDDGAKIEAEVFGRRIAFRLGAPGLHIARDALAALLAIEALDGDLLNAAAALSAFEPLKGRGVRFDVAVADGSAKILDESYNANPASMSAAIALLGAAKVRAHGRRIAVLGDMLELGPDGPALHAALARDIEAARTDVVFTCGPQMRALWRNLSETRRGAHGERSTDIAPRVVDAVHDGDVVLIKGSLGSRMAVIVDALKAPRAGS